MSFNLSRIVVLSAGFAAIALFSLYTFSDSLSQLGPKAKAGEKISPGQGLIVPTNASTSSFSLYENRDSPQDFYSINFPSDAEVLHGSGDGSISANLNDGTAYTVRFVEIPDSTTTQLYILTQEEPRLSMLKNYTRISLSERGTANGNFAAWSILYTWINGTQQAKSIESIIEGSNHAAVFSYSAPAPQFDKTNSTTQAILNSFRWTG
jgi:hypothetical protein